MIPGLRFAGSEERGASRPLGAPRMFAATVWLGFVIFPVINAAADHTSPIRKTLTVAGAAVFVVAYLFLIFRWRSEERPVPPLGVLGVMMATAAALTLGDRPSWGFLFIYCAAAGPLMTRAAWAFGAVCLATVLAGGVTAIAGGSAGTALSFGTSSAGIGLLMMLVRDLRRRNDELSSARAELARLAVTQERERFARDLHDLLGHTLSVIARKAELAGRLLPGQPERAAGEIADVEQVARQALTEVREAVSGYRQPTLEGELAGARMALSAAGIEADIDRADVVLDPGVEAVLAWTVREGATNVIRHTAAKHCRLRVTAGLTEAGVEVLDDGPARSNGDGGGHGLAGLRERVDALQGAMSAGPLTEGGYRLAVSVPRGAELS